MDENRSRRPARAGKHVALRVLEGREEIVVRPDSLDAATLGVTDLIGGIGSAAPGPLFLVDDVGRVHAMNARAREMGERHPSSEAFVSPVTLADRRVGHVVGYAGGTADEDAPLVSAIVALAADVLTRTWQRRAPVPSVAALPAHLRAQADLDIARERLGSVLDEGAIAEILVTSARAALGARSAVLLALSASRRSLVPLAAAGVDEGQLRKVGVGRGLVGWAATQSSPTCVESWHRLPAECPRHVGARCSLEAWVGLPFVAIPVMSGSQLIALLCVSGVSGVTQQRPAREAARLLEGLVDKAAANLTGARVVRQVRREERVGRELEIARQIQASLLPQHRLEFAGLDVAGECRPAAQVGGDYFGFRVDEPGCLTTTVFDAAGHGIGAAFCMTLVRSALNAELARGGVLSDVLQRANSLVWDDVATSSLFATALVCRFARDERKLTYGSAGHAPPLHWSSRQRRFLDHSRGGLPLGLMPDAGYGSYEADFAEGDVFVAYTDGIVEATNGAGERFGRARLMAVAHRRRRGTARKALQGIWRELEAFMGDLPLRDDATLLVVKGSRRSPIGVIERDESRTASRARRPLETTNTGSRG